MPARTVEQIDEQIARLKARRQAVVARDRKAERKARNHALMVMGGLLERACGGNWRAIDWDGLACALAYERDYIAGRAAGEALPTLEAAARLRDWERRGRESRKKTHPDLDEATGEGGTQPHKPNSIAFGFARAFAESQAQSGLTGD